MEILKKLILMKAIDFDYDSNDLSSLLKEVLEPFYLLKMQSL